MSAHSDEYRGYQIKWEITLVPEAKLWKAQAAIILPPNSSGISNSYTLTGPFDRFQTEAEARGHIILAAKEWIDKQFDGA
jgi:hypothetical protein